MEPAMEPGATRPCPCCYKPLGERQIRRHLAKLKQQLELDFAALGDLTLDDINPGPDGNVPAPIEADPAPGGANLGVAMDMEDEDWGEGEDGDNGREPMDDAGDLEMANGNYELPGPPAAHQQYYPVTIEDWPDPDDDYASSVEEDDQSVGSNRDPEYVERDVPLGLNPEDEPALDHEDLRAMLEDELGDLADEEWLDMYTREITDKDRTILQFLASRLRTHFSRQTYNDLRHGACEPLDIPSEFIAWRRLRILSGLETRAYDCCVNSCCCFLGKYEDLDVCPFCNERRRNDNGKARRSFHYTPLIPQLQSLFQHPTSIEDMRYRAKAEANYDPDTIHDVFDGENYRTLRTTQVREGDNYRFFDNPTDIALSLGTDGFTLFKRRRRGSSTAWPIILVNLNLHPKMRSQLENVICVGVVPGPKQCKDLNSFLIPLIEELLILEGGVESSKVASNGDGEQPAPGGNDAEVSLFVLRAFLILLFGDIPAVSKLLDMKGHNAIIPCRACYIQGVLCRLARSSVYYVPLTAPGSQEPFPADALIMRTHALFLFHYTQLEAAPTNAARGRVAKECGINSRSVFARLKSIDLASSAPYDMMHLLFENLVPNMIKHWTGNFKGLGQGTGNYQLSGEQWAEIGRLTANAARTVPSAFVGTLPNIAEDGNFYKADAYSFWFQYIAPVVLKDQLPELYYRHFLDMREIFIRCLAFKITREQLDQLQNMVYKWVREYKELYYQHQQARLPACTLTIHALLHMPYYIRRTGPLWASWAFVMERFCGHLLPAAKNRVRPYDHLNNYIQRRAQMQIVSRVYRMRSLAKPKINYTIHGDEKVSSREKMYEDFPGVIVGTPIRQNFQVTPTITNRLTKYFGVVYEGLRGRDLRERLKLDTLVRYGRFRLVSDGDRARVADAITRDPIARDNSFLRYQLLPDANANHRNLPDVPIRVTYYGQLLDIFYVEFIDPEDEIQKPFLLAHVKDCSNTNGADAALPESPLVKYSRLSTPEIIHIETVNAVVGRIQLNHNTWAIVDQSRHGLRTQFVNDDGNNLD